MQKRNIVWLLALLLFVVPVMADLSTNLNTTYNFSTNANADYGNCNGVITGATQTTGIYNNAYDFDGVGDDINFAKCHLINFSANDYTINMWTQFDTLEQEFLFNMNDGGAGIYYTAPYSSDNIRFYLDTYTATDVDYITSAGSIVIGGSWQMLTVVWNSSGRSVKIYINGTEATYTTQQAGVGLTQEWNKNLRLGTYDGSTVGTNFDGVIDAFSMWTTQLSPSDITCLYNSGLGREYPFGTCAAAPAGVNTTNFMFYDLFDNSAVSNFTVTVSNSTVTLVNSTNTGTAGFYNQTLNGTFNVTITNPNFYNITYSLDINVNSSISLNGYTSLVTVSVNNTITNTTYAYFNVTYGNQTYSVTNGSVTLYGSSRSSSLAVKGNNFWHNASAVSYTNLSQNVFSVGTTSHMLNVTANFFGSAISTFTITLNRQSTDYGQYQTYSTTNGVATFNVLNGTYNVSIVANGYSYANQLITLNGTFHQLNFSLLESTAFNITFRDMFSRNIITYTNISLELISDEQSGNYSTSNGTLTVSLLAPSVYTLRYGGFLYPTHFYYFTLNNGTYNNLNLYLHNYSMYSNVTITVINEYGDPVENAQVHTSRYDLSTNTDILQQICSTNFEGKCSANMQLNTEFYTFTVYYNDQLKKTVTRTLITSTSYQISVILGTSTGAHYFDFKDIDYTLYYTNSTKTFTMFYSDSESLASAGCLYVYSAPLFGSNPVYTLSNTSCATGASSTLTATIIPVNNTRYRADSFVTKSGTTYYLGSVYINYRSDVNDFGREALILCVLLTLVVLFAFYGVNPSVAVALMPMPLFAFTAFGLVNLSIGIVTGLYVIILIFAFGIMER